MTGPMPEELPQGFVFGSYLIHDCIGRGGMARVYRAENTALQKPVALKVLDQWVLDKPGGRDRFLREARTAAAIKHPNVVDIVDVGVWGERPYIVMELLKGRDLEGELERRGALSESEVVGLALPIIRGMMAVHEAGVVHRDIKPSNIFLCDGAEGEIIPKVLDFGISKFCDSLLEPMGGLTKTREIIGTPTYMAPEALNGARELGPRADQYALGAVLYDCAVGRPPFEGDTLLELLKAIALGTVTAPRSIRPELSVAFEGAILQAMNANPEGRFETLRDLGRALWPLADERTRMIWARSFGSSNRSKSSALTDLAMVSPKRRIRPGSWRRGLTWVPVLGSLGVVGALAVLWQCSSSESASPQATSSPGATPVVSALSLHGDAPAPAAANQPDPSDRADQLADNRAERKDAPGSNEEPVARSAAGSRVKRWKLAIAQRERSELRDSPLNANQSAARTASRAPLASRGTSNGAKMKSASDGMDPDLPKLFEPGPGAEFGSPEAAGAGSELTVFPPSAGTTLGANGSPITD